MTISEEYLLYPLWRLDANARTAKTQNGEPPLLAAVVYPAGQTNAFMSNIGVPVDKVHVFRSKSFFWSGDSRAVVFTDSVNGSLSAVLVRIDDGIPTTLVRPLSTADICDIGANAATIASVTLSEARISDAVEDTEIQMNFTSSSSDCKAKTVTLRAAEFRSPTPEVHLLHQRRPSVPISR